MRLKTVHRAQKWIHLYVWIKQFNFVCLFAASFIVHSPVAIFYQLTDQGCELNIGKDGNGAKYYYLGAFLSMYVIPLMIILMCYAKILIIVWRKTSAGTESAQAHERSIRQKRKITRMVFIVVLLFAVCWAPIHCILLWEQFKTEDITNLSTAMAFACLRLFALCLAYANSLTNPFIYAFTTASFKKHFKKVLSCSTPTESKEQKTMGPTSTYKKIGKYVNEYSSVNTCDTKVWKGFIGSTMLCFDTSPRRAHISVVVVARKYMHILKLSKYLSLSDLSSNWRPSVPYVYRALTLSTHPRVSLSFLSF